MTLRGNSKRRWIFLLPPGKPGCPPHLLSLCDVHLLAGLSWGRVALTLPQRWSHSEPAKRPTRELINPYQQPYGLSSLGAGCSFGPVGESEPQGPRPPLPGPRAPAVEQREKPTSSDRSGSRRVALMLGDRGQGVGGQWASLSRWAFLSPPALLGPKRQRHSPSACSVDSSQFGLPEFRSQLCPTRFLTLRAIFPSIKHGNGGPPPLVSRTR